MLKTCGSTGWVDSAQNLWYCFGKTVQKTCGGMVLIHSVKSLWGYAFDKQYKELMVVWF